MATLVKILLTSPTYPPFNSGLGNAVSQQAALLCAAGHDVVVATSGPLRATREDAASGARVEEFPITGADSLLQPMHGDISAYVEFLQESVFDVVLMNAWQNWATDLLLQHIGGIGGRKFLYSHCISTNVFYWRQPIRSSLRYLAWRPYWWRLKHRMQSLDGVIFLAAGGVDTRFADLAIARKCAAAIHVIPNSLSLQAANVLRRPIADLGERNQIIAVGAYQWQKGFDFVLQAYAVSSAKDRIPLKFFGQAFSAYTDMLRKMVVKLGIKPNFVLFEEGVSGSNLLAEYFKAKLLLSGSHTECQPLVILDANAAGTPFIARSTGCIAQMPGGVCVKSLEDMASEIDVLIANQALWKATSDAGRVVATEIYHPDKVGCLLLNVLETLPQQNRSTDLN
jgi:glycosyltransferase involved in cell wall biosynthesis